MKEKDVTVNQNNEEEEDDGLLDPNHITGVGHDE